MSLYDPYGSSEDGVITLHPEEDFIGAETKVYGWPVIEHGIVIDQGAQVVFLDANQMEQLYEILKHNR